MSSPSLSISDRAHVRRRWQPLLALLAVLTLVLSACSSGPDAEDDPRAALADAFESLAEWDGIELELRVSLDDDARAQVLAEEDLTAEELDVLLSSSVRVAGSSDREAGGTEISLVLGGTDAVQVRVTADAELFFRMDLEAIAEVAEDAEFEDLDIEELTVAARMFGLGDVATALVEGSWVEIIGLDDLAELAGEEPVVDEDLDIDQEELDALLERFAEEMTQLIEQDAEVTFIGTEDAGDRIRVATSSAALAEVLGTVTLELERLVGSEFAGDLGDPDEFVDEFVEEFGDEDITIDLWVDGGELTQFGVDLQTLDDEGELDGEVLILVTVAEFTGTIDAPADATEFDVLQLVGAFFGGMGGDPFGDDLFGDDPFEDDGFLDDDPFEDDAFEDDAFEDDGFEDDAFDDDAFDDDGFGDPECITEEELEDIGEFFGDEALEEFEELIELGFLELC
ncbi:MAG: hypothetical protein JJT89_16875 [Nitriliruptoraceae bacterium]|nr:hypothetical protein [Nitriliruptoraceae bacterium]